jgi:hypothetical protein
MEIDIPDPVITVSASFNERDNSFTSHVRIEGEPIFTREYTSVYETYEDIDHPKFASGYTDAEQKTMRAFAKALRYLLKGTER